MKLNKIAQLLIAASCFAGSAASAATYTVAFDSSNIVVSQDTDWSDFLNFQKFDTTLGTLTSVKFDLYSNVAGSVDLTNYNDDLAQVPVSLGVNVFLNRPDNTGLVVINAPLFNTTLDVEGGGGTASIANEYLAHNAAIYTNLSDLALFSGSGYVTTLISAQANSSVIGDGIDAQFSTTAGGYGTVTYTYTTAPVPEPETYGMLLLGLGLMGVVAKRKQSAKA